MPCTIATTRLRFRHFYRYLPDAATDTIHLTQDKNYTGKMSAVEEQSLFSTVLGFFVPT